MYQSFIGLEIHIQLLTKSKVFCSCANRYGDEPNTNICPICMGYPGVLPALNGEAIRMGYVVARALNCALSREAVFDRKNYFYPDMPKNYQISMYGSPIGRDGWMDIEFRKKKKRVRIHEVHLEEDAGKMIHAGDMSLLDYNRAGTPLLEIVSEPDMEIGEEAEVLLHNFRRLVRYLGVCDGNMEEGSLRCDANVSVNLRGAGLGRKVEIKNLNSSRFVRLALNHEIARQEEILGRGGTVVQETRLWNENRDCTESMRRKESAHDYRYFPEPDLPPFRADEAFWAAVEAGLVELPLDRRARFMSAFGLSEEQADFLCDERPRADYFERVAALGADPAAAAAWLASDVKRVLNRDNLELASCPLSERRLARLLALLAEGRIHSRIAKQTLEAVFAEDRDPDEIIRDKGWEQIADRAALGGVIDEVIARNGRVADAVRAGDLRQTTFLVGQVMKATEGRAEPRLVQTLLKERLSLAQVLVLAFGGAISGLRESGGAIAAGDGGALCELAAGVPALAEDVSAGRLRFEQLPLGRFLSEEITPEDWAVLVSSLRRVLAEGGATGVVVAHGTDTLPYTAALLHWMLGSVSVPIVLTAASAPAGAEAAANLSLAVERARSGPPGVNVVFGGGVFSPLNLKFERIHPMRFTTWNASELKAPRLAAVEQGGETDAALLRARLEAAVRLAVVVKVYPGMPGDLLVSLMQAGVRYFVLELYDTGTANLRRSPFSLKRAFDCGRANGAIFFCTSQQEGVVDFSEYVTGHELWKEGAVPMGALTTESTYARLLACLAALGPDAPAEAVAAAMEG